MAPMSPPWHCSATMPLATSVCPATATAAHLSPIRRSTAACTSRRRTSDGAEPQLVAQCLIQQTGEPNAGLLKLLLDDRQVRIDVRLIDLHAAGGLAATGAV